MLLCWQRYVVAYCKRIAGSEQACKSKGLPLPVALPTPLLQEKNMPKSIIIYGPQGCGKTVNVEALREVYSCKRIDDSDSFGVKGFKFEANSGVLYVTNDPTVLVKWSEHPITFSVAVKNIKKQVKTKSQVL